MHLPDGSLDNVTCTVTTVLAAGAAAYACRRVRAESSAWSPAAFGAVAAFIFAVQMVNFPVAAGVSGHMVGGVLAGALLGPWLGLLAMVLVLAAQCLLAGDGGLTALGANILTMGVAATWAGSLIRRTMEAKTHGKSTLAAVVAAWGSVIVAGTLCAMIWSVGSALTLGQVLGPMLAVHARIGLGEALVTGALLAAIAWKPEQSLAQRISVVAALGAGVAIVLAPWASAAPDGLEHVASAFTQWPEAGLAFAPLPDYLVPGVSNELLATTLAGVIGAATVYAAGRFSSQALAFPARTNHGK